MFFVYIYIFKACVQRTKSAPCHLVTDRGTCLTTTDSRKWLNGQDCVWCPNGPCTNNNANRCEPKEWLEVKSGDTNYEHCLVTDSGN